MLKGQEEFPIAIGTVIFVVVIFILLAFIYFEFRSLENFLETKSETIEEIEVVRLVASCLGDNGIIEQERLEAGINDLEKECNINRDAAVLVVDRETSKTWRFGKNKKLDRAESMFVNIKSEDGIHVGEIYADV